MSVSFIAVLVILIAVLTSLFLVARKKDLEKYTRLLLFALYFWLVSFIQLIVIALVYSIGNNG